jgi:fermentation-respiration switch protein FrsA (DUF1100 family)
VLDAVMTGRGWDAVPEPLRERADTAWFRTWLLFDPARAIARIDQPILVLHGALDREVPVEEAARLEELALRRRGRTATVQKSIVAGANHLFLPAATGEVDEYLTIEPKAIAPEAVSTLIGWLKATLSGR